MLHLGTTGAPKGVTYTHRASFLHTLRLLQADVVGITAADSVLTVVPMFHASAWGLPFAVPAVGAKLVLPGRHADGASLARLIAAEGVTIAVGCADGLAGPGRTSRGDRRRVADAETHPGRRRALAARVDGTYRATPRCFVADQLGHDRAVAVGHDVGAERSETIGRCSGRPAVGVDLLLTDADGRALPEQRGIEGASARARCERHRALFRR